MVNQRVEQSRRSSNKIVQSHRKPLLIVENEHHVFINIDVDLTKLIYLFAVKCTVRDWHKQKIMLCSFLLD